MTAVQPPEVLTVEEYAERLKVSRATVFAWMQKGFLTQGRHFFRLGRVLRFVWRVDHFIQPLPEDRLNEGGDTPSVAEKAAVPTEGRPAAAPAAKLPRKKAAPVNWDY